MGAETQKPSRYDSYKQPSARCAAAAMLREMHQLHAGRVLSGCQLWIAATYFKACVPELRFLPTVDIKHMCRVQSVGAVS